MCERRRNNSRMRIESYVGQQTGGDEAKSTVRLGFVEAAVGAIEKAGMLQWSNCSCRPRRRTLCGLHLIHRIQHQDLAGNARRAGAAER